MRKGVFELGQACIGKEPGDGDRGGVLSGDREASGGSVNDFKYGGVSSRGGRGFGLDLDGSRGGCDFGLVQWYSVEVLHVPYDHLSRLVH